MVWAWGCRAGPCGAHTGFVPLQSRGGSFSVVPSLTAQPATAACGWSPHQQALTVSPALDVESAVPAAMVWAWGCRAGPGGALCCFFAIYLLFRQSPLLGNSVSLQKTFIGLSCMHESGGRRGARCGFHAALAFHLQWCDQESSPAKAAAESRRDRRHCRPRHHPRCLSEGSPAESRCGCHRPHSKADRCSRCRH